jgi:hypothetical protein
VRLFPSKGDLRRRFVLLSPSRPHSSVFGESSVDGSLHRKLLADAQRLRGSVYLQIGAIEPSQLLSDGRHVQTDDSKSWHLLTLDEHGRVAACTRYLSHPSTVSFSELTVSHSALATSDKWARRFRQAIEAELALARKRGWSYVEMGGWVISEKMRCTTEAVRMVLAAYGLAQISGGALGIATVTQHGSSPVLRRIGGGSLLSRGAELPPYYEPQYKFEMEILRFDSSRPSPRYSAWVDDCRAYLQTVPVICAKPARKPLEEIRIAVANSFRHTDRNHSVDAISEKAAWERSTGVA